MHTDQLNSYDYLNFEVTIRKHDERFWAQVTDCPESAKSEETALLLPFEETLSRLVEKLEDAVLQSTMESVGIHISKHEKSLRDFGHAIHKAVFIDSQSVRDSFVSSLTVAHEKGQGLRLRLCVEPSELAALPWEYLYNKADDRTNRGYVCLYRSTPVVRSLRSGLPQRSLQVDGPIKVLGMIANPTNGHHTGQYNSQFDDEWEPLDTAKERRRINDAIGPLEKAGKIHFQWVPGETAQQLLTMMRKDTWHVFHFIGHGGSGKDSTTIDGDIHGDEEGFIVLADDEGRPIEVPASDIFYLLEGRGSLRLAVLNCCYSACTSGLDTYASPGASLIRCGVPAVVAMQYPISDRAAMSFASGFYSSLSDGLPVDIALTEARNLVRQKSKVEWGVPVLYMRAPNGQLFTRNTEQLPENVTDPEIAISPFPERQTAIDEVEPPLLHAGSAETLQTNSDPLLRFWAQIKKQSNDQTANQTTAEIAEALQSGNFRDLQLPNQDLVALPEEKTKLVDDFPDSGEFSDLTLDELTAIINKANEILDLLPNDQKTSFKIALAYHCRGVQRFGANQEKAQEAIDDLSKAISLDKSRADSFFERAKLRGRAGDYGLALSDLSSAIKIDAGNAEYYWALGVLRTLSALSDDDSVDQAHAISAFDKAIALKPDVAKYYNSRAGALKNSGQYDLAILDLDHAIELEPKEMKYQKLRERIQKENASRRA